MSVHQARIARSKLRRFSLKILSQYDMNILTTFLIVALVTLMTAGGQAAPVRGHNCTPDSSTTAPENSTDALNNSTTVNTTTTSHNITVLQTDAARKIYGVVQEIEELENYTVSHQVYIHRMLLLNTNIIFSCLCRERHTTCPLTAAMYGLSLPTML